MSKKFLFLISLVLVIGVASSASAQTRQVDWTDGGGDHLWCNPANWSTGEVPFVSDWSNWTVDRPWIDIENMTDPVLISADQTCTPEGGHVVVGDTVDTGPGVALNMTGGEARFMEIAMGYSVGGVGTMTMSGGHIQLDHYGYLGMGDGGDGTLIMTGGTIDCNGTTWIGAATTWGSAIIVPKNEQGEGTGHLQLDGGTIKARRLSINDRGTVDITGGKIILREYSGVWGGLNTQADVIASVEGDIADGNLMAYGGSGIVGIAIREPEDPCDPNEIWILGRLDAGTAWNPTPDNGAIDILRDVVLKWSPGDYVQSTNGHKVYFADNFADVDNRAGGAYKVAQTATTYDAGQLETLEVAKTYYWAIDEVNSVTTWPGPVWQFTMDRGVAKNPYPADGSDEIPKNVVLNWKPGIDANAVKGHDVYFGTDYDDVNDANKLSSEYQDTIDANHWDSNNYAPAGLDLVTTYYWRIDEVNGTNRWEGDVWSFEVEGRAKNPYPADGGRGIPSLELVLRWEAGTDAASHDVYFGSNKTAVADANTSSDPNIYRVRQSLSDVNYLVPEDLDVRETYYWRIDEVNTATLKGHVWSFTTGPFLVVDSFEFYEDTAAIRAVWKDFWSDPPSENGASVFVETDPNFTRNSLQSMKYDFKNFDQAGSPAKYVGSWAEADATDLEFASNDWTRGGVKAMVLYFIGDPCNGKDTTWVYDPGGPNPPLCVDQMYIALEDGSANEGVVKYDTEHGYDMNDIKEAIWHEWNVDLQDFNDAGVALTDVSKVYLGFGGQRVGQAAAGAGDEWGYSDTVYFDDIRLYPPRCMPSITGIENLRLLGDITADCNTNYSDLAIMARDWNMRGMWALATIPDINAVVEYLFNDGSGSTIVTNTGDYNDPNYDLTIGMGWDANDNPIAEPNNDPCWLLDADPCRGWTLAFDGEMGWSGGEADDSNGGDYLVIPPLNLNTNTATIAAWINPHPHCLEVKKEVCVSYGQRESFTGIVHSRNASTVAGLSYGSGTGFTYDGSLGYVWSDNDPDTWGFETNIFIPDWKWSFVAVVIEPGKATCYIGDPNGVLRTATNPIAHIPEEFDGRTIIGSDENSNARFFSGQIDDVRIYDVALSAGQILGLADIPGIVYIPLSSSADFVVGIKDPCDPNDPIDDQIDFADYAALAKHWLEQHPWP